MSALLLVPSFITHFPFLPTYLCIFYSLNLPFKHCFFESCTLLFYFLVFINSFICLLERHMDRDHPSTGSLPKCLQQSGLDQLKPGAQDSFQISHMGGRDIYLSHHILPPRVHDSKKKSWSLEQSWT